MEKKIIKELQRELLSGFEQSVYIGCQKLIELAAKYVFTDSEKNEQYLKAAQNRLVLMFGYCAFNELPVSGTALIRILKESETDEKLMCDLQYKYSDEFQRSVNEVLYACINFYIQIGEQINE